MYLIFLTVLSKRRRRKRCFFPVGPRALLEACERLWGTERMCTKNISMYCFTLSVLVLQLNFYLIYLFKLILAAGIEKLMNRKKVKTKEFFMMIMAALKNLKVLST